MPWGPMDIVSLRREFVTRASAGAASFSALCSEYNISRKTGYKWLSRHREGGDEGLKDLSRRPRSQRGKLGEDMEREIVRLRRDRPVWGARKLRKLLERGGVRPLPAKSTVNEVLRRNGLISPEASEASKPFTRFERAEPNSLWQMDFKGWFNTVEHPCHPLTVLDDHSRYALCITALPAERKELVQASLEEAFSRYGMPNAIITDNGSPWGSDSQRRHTVLGAWLMRLGIEHLHSRPYHPQTCGKDERFHRTLKLEVISRRQWESLAECQEAFDEWRSRYNTERPHEALDGLSPVERYRASEREYTGPPPPPEYPEGAVTRKVDAKGRISFQGQGAAGEQGLPRRQGDAGACPGWRHGCNLRQVKGGNPRPGTGHMKSVTYVPGTFVTHVPGLNTAGEGGPAPHPPATLTLSKDAAP